MHRNTQLATENTGANQFCALHKRMEDILAFQVSVLGGGRAFRCCAPKPRADWRRRKKMNFHSKSKLRLSSAVLASLLMASPALAGNSRDVETKLYGYVGKDAQTAFAASARKQLSATSVARAAKSKAARVLFWHDALLDSIGIDLTYDPNLGYTPADQVGPTRAARAMAITQIAVFDALNSFDGTYRSYSQMARAQKGASEDVAIAYAAHKTLSALFPDQAVRLAQLLADDLSSITASAGARAKGRAVGEAAAAAILSSRATDNSYAFADEPSFGEGGVLASGGTTTSSGNGVNDGAVGPLQWSPDPLTPNPSTPSGLNELALGAGWGNVTPFALTSGDQFRVPPPPAPGTPEYNAAHSEVASIGGAPTNANTLSASTPTTRFIGNYWGYDAVPRLGTPPRLYGQIIKQIVIDKKVPNAAHLARLLARTHIAMADAGIAAWDSKYYYNYWRPVRGVRTEDGVAATATDPTWDPVGASVINTTAAIRATPPFPAYPSGHATFGAASFEVLRDEFGDIPFTFVSEEYDGQGVDPFGTPRPLVPVRFNSLTEAQHENGESRIYNGVHWAYDNTSGQTLGVQISRHILDNFAPFRKSK